MRRHTMVIAIVGLLVLAQPARAQDAPSTTPPAPNPPSKDPIREAYEAHAPTPALPFPAPEDLKPIPDPDPLVFMDGRKVRTKEDWEARKKEILDLAHHYIYGFCGPEELVKGTPGPEVTNELKDACGGLATMREIKVSLTPETDDPKGVIWLSLAIPNKGTGPFPAVLHFERLGEPNTEYAVKRGYAVAGFSPQSGMSMYKYYFPIHSGPWVDDSDPRFAARPKNAPRIGRRPLHGWGERVVWGWRMRRMMDALVTQKDIDAQRVIFAGGSRGGQSVVLAAAMDPRAAMVYCWQGLPQIRSHIFRPEWHAPHAQEFRGREDRLPVDLYCATAVIAPRPILFTEAREGKGYIYSSSPFVYEKIASAYRFLGAEVQMEKDPGPGNSRMYSHGPLGLHVRDGGHSGHPDDWKCMLDFADEYLKPKPR